MLASFASQAATVGESAAPVSVDGSNLRKKAEDAFLAQDWPLAAQLWKRYVQGNPKDLEALTRLGQAYSQSAQPELAIDAFRQATLVAPDDSDVWTSLCWSSIVANRIAAARSPCQRAADLDPSSVGAIVNLGHVHLLSGDASGARSYYIRAMHLIGSEDEYKHGPAEDFLLFIEKGWQVDASRAAMAWFAKEITDRGPLGLARRALEEMERLKGPEHPRTGASLNNLASLFQSMGQYDKALPLYLRALAISEKVHGPEHPDTGIHLNNLAGLYEVMGQYEKALPLHLRSLSISERTDGPEHPGTGASLSNLAGLYKSMGQYDKALPLYLRALSISEKLPGPEHPGTGTRLNNLAQLYKFMGRYDKALPMYLRALSISEKAEGPDHPGTGVSLNNLASLHMAMGQYDKAVNDRHIPATS